MQATYLNGRANKSPSFDENADLSYGFVNKYVLYIEYLFCSLICSPIFNQARAFSVPEYFQRGIMMSRLQPAACSIYGQVQVQQTDADFLLSSIIRTCMQMVAMNINESIQLLAPIH